MKRTLSTAFHQPNNNTDITDDDTDIAGEDTDNDPAPKPVPPTMHVRDATPDPIAPIGPSPATPIQALGPITQPLLVSRGQTTGAQQASESTPQMAIQAADLDLADEKGRTRLMLAAKNGDLPTVQALLSHGANGNLADNEGRTALMLAAEKGQLATVQALLGSPGIYIDAKKDDGVTAFYLAAVNGHCDLVKALIKKGANVNIVNTDKRRTALMLAAAFGYLTTVQALLDAPGIDINAKKYYGVTTLYYAAIRGQYDVVKALIDHGADIDEGIIERLNTMLHNSDDDSDDDDSDDVGSDVSIVATLQLLMNCRAQRQANVGNLNEEATWASSCATSAIPPKASAEVIPSLKSLALETLLQQAQAEVPSLLQISFKATRDQLLQFKPSAMQVGDLIRLLHSCPFASALVQTLAVAIKLGGYHTKADQNFIYEKLNAFDLLDAYKKSQSCLDSGNINRWQTSGQTLLTRAAQAGDLPLVEALITCGAAIYLPDQHGNNALHAAVKAGKWSVCSHLLALGANPNTSDRSRVSTLTYLAQAFARGDEQTAAFVVSLLGPLLAKGHRLEVVVNDPDDLEEGTETTILKILRSDLNRYVLYADFLHADGVNHTDNNGWTPLMLAVAEGLLTAVQALLSAPRIDINAQKPDGETALFVAANQGEDDVVKALINKRADVNIAKINGWTPLMVAAGKGLLAITQALLSAPRIDINAQKPDGATALHVAIANGQDDVVKPLINKRADVNLADNTGWTPLMFAAEKGLLAITQALLSAPGIDINAQKPDGETALYVAVNQGKDDVVKALINKRADVNIARINGWTPLMFAAEKGHLTITQALLSAPRIDINAKKPDGATALHVAVNQGKDDVVKALIKQGADVDITDNDGQTPMMVANSLGYMTIVQEFFDRY
jgi:ankyrin repeat protein